VIATFTSVPSKNFVWAREQGRLDHGQQGIEWMLYTTSAVTNLGEAYSALQRYSFRWRIEGMHRTRKSGTCNAEDMHLRSPEAAIEWACMLGALQQNETNAQALRGGGLARVRSAAAIRAGQAA
jgi:hypothetical protein